MDNPFYRSIEQSTAHRPIRDLLSTEIIANPELFPHLLQLALNPSDTSHHKACWILELVLEKHLDWLFPYLEQFTQTLPSFSHDGAKRSISKIVMFLSRRHIKAAFLSEKQQLQLTETCFDWLINDDKVATKAYAIRSLFELGKLNDWIYPELKTILEKDYRIHSAGYKAVAREILRKI